MKKPKSPNAYGLKWIDDNLVYNPLTGYIKNYYTNSTIGWQGKHDYWYVNIKIGDGFREKRNVKASHVAWYLSYGYWPNKTIDHKDQNRLNDKLDNLRLLSEREQQWNRSNKSKYYPGVSLIKSTKRFQTTIQIGRKSINLGTFDTPEEARDAYLLKLKEIDGS